MATFQYIARTTQGQMVSGAVDASDSTSAMEMLKSKGLAPTQIRAMAGKKKAKKAKGGRIKLDDMVIFSRQLAVMIRAGLPLLEILDILSEQLEKRAFQNVMIQVRNDVESGSSFTEALQRHPTVFNPFFVSMIRAGEAAGMLDTILEQVAVYQEKVASLQRKIKGAITYPAFVSFFAVIILIVIMVWVVPAFEEIFAAADSELPLLTKIVVGISDFLGATWYYILGGFIVAFFIFSKWKKTRSGRYFVDTVSMRIPIFGPLIIKGSVAKFSRTFSVLIRSGVNILTALDIVSSTAGNILIEDAVQKTKVSIQGGESIAVPLGESNVFPPMVVRMIAIGERTGNMESMLQKVADFYEDQVDATVNQLSSLIEPILIIGLGLVVGTIVIAMFMPMFKMIEDLG